MEDLEVPEVPVPADPGAPVAVITVPSFLERNEPDPATGRRSISIVPFL